MSDLLKLPNLDDLLEDDQNKRRRKLSLSQEQSDSLLQQIAKSRPAGALAKIGNILDTPGGIVRNVLAGRNPLPGIFDPQQRASGRDILENVGILGPNQEGFDAGDVGGFLAEIALDPLTYITLGGSALSKGGQVAKRAGLLGKTSRVKRMTTTLGELAGDAASIDKLKTAADGADIVKHLDKPVGGLVGIGLPFREASFTIGQGATAQKIAGGLDKVSDAARFGNIPGTNYSPGRHFHQAFNSDVKGTYTRPAQEAAMDLSQRQRDAQVGLRSLVAKHAMELENLGMGTHEAEGRVRRLYEGVIEPANDIEAGLVREHHDFASNVISEMQSLGMNRKELNDIIDYTTRFATLPKTRSANLGPFTVREGTSFARKQHLKGIPEGTAALQELFRHKGINDLIDAEAKVKDIAEAMKTHFGSKIPEKFDTGLVNEAGEKVMGDRYRRLAALARKLPRETRDAGLFGNSTLADFQMGMTGALNATEAHRAVMNLLEKNAVAAPKEAIQAGTHIPVKKILKKMGVNVPEPTELSDDMIEALAETGEEAAPEFLNIGPLSAESIDKAIPADLAKEVLSFQEGWKAPEAVSKLGSAFDQYNSLFKAGVLSWPATHVRNLVSSLHRNWQAGHVDLSRLAGSAKEGLDVVRGIAPKTVQDIPAVAKALAERQMEATPENGLQVLKELLYAHQVAGPGQSRLSMVGAKGAEQGRKIEDVLHSIPGNAPPTLKSIKDKALGRAPGTSFNPFDIQGFVGRTESGFAPVAASNEIGQGVEAVARIAPFMELLRKGVDPSEAARRVLDAQVDYSTKALTKTEQGLTRLAPFYRFFRGNIPSQLRELAEHPGGNLAQTLRGLNNARSTDEIVPDYVHDTAGIRIPEGVPVIGPGKGGDPRYLTGLGLMFEDLGGLIGNGPVDTMRELATNLGPIPKAPIEAITGKSLFQKGPDGLVDLKDQDPVIGRILANAIGRDEAVHTPGLLEQVSANLPTTRAMSTIRTLTDRRKNIGTKALNTLTGVRLTDVPEKRRDAILRQLLNEQMLAAGAKSFEKVYFPADDLAGMSAAEGLAAANATALQTELANRAKKRAAQRNKNAAP